jgi:hypothetical protein
MSKPTDTIYEYLFHLLGNALWGKAVEPDIFKGMDGAGWAALWHEAGRQTVGPLIFYPALSLPEDCLPPRDLRLRMVAGVGRTEEENHHKERVLAEIARIYASGGIDFVLLKGFAAAAAYPVPERRTEGDLDFYMPGPGEAARGHELLFHKEARLKERQDRHYSDTYKGVVIENHFDLLHSSLPLYGQLEKELTVMLGDGNNMELALGGAAVPVPCPDFHILFMIDHAAFHLIGGLGLRHLCDIARYLWFYRDRIDREKTAAAVEKYRFSRIVNAFMIICVDRLGMPEEVSPVAIDRSTGAMKDAAYVLEQIIAGGNFGHHFDESHDPQRHYKAGALRRKFLSLKVIMDNRRKYRLINPVLFRKVFSEALVSTLLNRAPDKRKQIVM